MSAYGMVITRAAHDSRLAGRLSHILEAVGATVLSVSTHEQGWDWRVLTKGGEASLRCPQGRGGLLAEVVLVEGAGDAVSALSVLRESLTAWAQGQLKPGDYLDVQYDWTDVVNAHLGGV